MHVGVDEPLAPLFRLAAGTAAPDRWDSVWAGTNPYEMSWNAALLMLAAGEDTGRWAERSLRRHVTDYGEPPAAPAAVARTLSPPSQRVLAEAGDAAARAVLAARDDIDPGVARLLARDADTEVVRAVSANLSAPDDVRAFAALAL